MPSPFFSSLNFSSSRSFFDLLLLLRSHILFFFTAVRSALYGIDPFFDFFFPPRNRISLARHQLSLTLIHPLYFSSLLLL
ncbi:unnamed protein product [Arabidopsis halleri]